MYTKNESVATFSKDPEDVEQSRKDEARRSIFDRVLGVWKSDEALSVIFFFFFFFIISILLYRNFF